MTKNGIIAFLAIAILPVACKRPAGVIEPSAVRPSHAQVEYQQMEMIGFIHFSINTFTGKEWGMGDESPELFNPSSLDAEQWAKTASEAGMKQLILTAKHHDGFCLWPSAYTGHSVKNSPWKDGQGDVVKEFTDACRRYSLKAGLYLSPWDRNHKDYGKPGYIEYYRAQLTELLTNYGKVSEIWFDGANGGYGYYGGAYEERHIDRETYYDWDSTFKLVYSLQPDIIIFSDAGPGCRWIGNEHGIAGTTCWSTINADSLTIGASNQAYLNTGDPDGSDWIPGECDVSIRPGWFYHPEQDSMLKSLEELKKIYHGSVGRNGVLLLNIPPDKRGMIHENDVTRLNELKDYIDRTFRDNLAANAIAQTDCPGTGQHGPQQMLDQDMGTFWACKPGEEEASAMFKLPAETTFDLIMTGENIAYGQRVRSFDVASWQDGQWTIIAEGTTIGYKRIIRTGTVTTSAVRLRIRDARAQALIASFGIYLESKQ